MLSDETFSLGELQDAEEELSRIEAIADIGTGLLALGCKKKGEKFAFNGEDGGLYINIEALSTLAQTVSAQTDALLDRDETQAARVLIGIGVVIDSLILGALQS